MIAEGDPLWPFYRITVPIQRAYKTVFGTGTPGGTTVLADLARYCFANAPTNNDREQGRRDVWLFIQKRLQLRDEEFLAIFAKLTPEQRRSMYERPDVPMYSPLEE